LTKADINFEDINNYMCVQFDTPEVCEMSIVIFFSFSFVNQLIVQLNDTCHFGNFYTSAFISFHYKPPYLDSSSLGGPSLISSPPAGCPFRFESLVFGISHENHPMALQGRLQTWCTTNRVEEVTRK